MKTRTSRQQQALETKSKLIDAALRTFSRKGFSESTTKDIAKEAGVTDGLIYHYFQSKEDLLWAILDKYTLLHSIRQALAAMDKQASLEHNLTAYFQALFRNLREQLDLVVMCFGEAQRNPEIRAQVEDIIREGVELLYAFVAPQVHLDRQELLVAIRNVQTSMVFYFLMTARFADDDTQSTEYIRISVKQFLNIVA
ncbi:TetR/AcrR family transcriptional regulator [Paenibacillus oleatilyticus]|uniref:TetR/AcrR family transcriptional regulator n=1 Tax=Paenibacillus oleatilyticus TaxID=2594886 RepID=UPI001C1F61BD|nr:TetR/AcrR family transcriptional regulator [Paenibacillus oleatilyticus]MBU7316952.1 TetR/AcrR family transcriptional regulator [Paenibacillus oleatilyticus]